MSTRWTAQDVTRVTLKRQLAQKPAKYRNKKTTIDNVTFDSAKEARRYQELKCLQAAGKIFRLELQPRYRLCAWVSSVRQEKGELPAELGSYVADFRYCNVRDCLCAYGCTVEDVKGLKTPLYRWKKKHFEAQYGIQIRET